MHFMKTIAFLVKGILPSFVVDRFVLKASSGPRINNVVNEKRTMRHNQTTKKATEVLP
jgi:hypothetical protein